MRRPAEFFDDKEVALVHIASTLRGALKLEDLLTANDVEYAVETDHYRSGFLFWTEKTGAFFYVEAAEAEACRALLRKNRFKAHTE
jgi:hypothetical protein